MSGFVFLSQIRAFITKRGAEALALSGMGRKRRLRSSTFHPLREAAFL